MTDPTFDPRRPPGLTKDTKDPEAKKNGKIVGISLGLLGALIAFIAISSNVARQAEPEEAVPSKYTQTWSESYSNTSCDDWNSVLTAEQQFAAAADILTSARNKIDGGTGKPSDGLIDEFAAGISNICVIPSMTLTDATYGLYTTEPRFHP